MKKAHGLRRYFYEYVFHQAIEQAREQSGEIIPISQAKAIRSHVDEVLGAQNSAIDDPQLGVSQCLSAMDQALAERVRDYEPQFGEHSPRDPRYQQLQRDFTRFTGVGAQTNPKSARLPVSPYDPQWSERSTIKRAGTSLRYIPDETIGRVSGGEVEGLSEPRHGNMIMWGVDDEGKAFEAGRAMTYDDAAGLTGLMDKMSAQEYDQVRDWVIDGGRDPQTGRIDRNRFMSPQAVARSSALLDELKAQGISYDVVRDRQPGQIKARISGTNMEVRLTDTQQEEYAGARIYDNGTVLRYSTNYRVPGGMAIYSPSPQEAVDLLHFAQGRSIERRDIPEREAGRIGTTHQERGRGRNVVNVPDSYHVDRESMFVVDDYVVPGQDEPSGSKVMLRRDAKNRSLPSFFVDADPAEAYGREAVSTARDNLQEALNVNGLIESFESQRNEGLNLVEFEPPTYSADPEVAAIQRSYWDVLTGVHSDLLRPGATEEMYQERLDSIGELQADESPDLGNLVYGGSAADKIRAHAEDVPFELIGTWDPEPHDVDGEWIEQRFDPTRVAKYMTSPTGQWSNMDNLAAALRRCEVPADQMMGSSFQTTRFKDRLITFDAESATPIADHESAFMRRIGDTVRNSLERNATTADEVLVDDKGVISWRGTKLRRDGKSIDVSGQIGQVFDVGEHGEIVTEFASGENALIVPGYEARIAAQTPGQAPTSVEERTLLRGYEQMMHERIQYQLAGDVVSGRSETGEPASLNPVYSQLYGTKHPVDFIEKATEYELNESTGEITTQLNDWTASILETEARRVRYSNEIKAGSTIYAEYRSQRDQADPADDNHFDAWRLTGGRNMTVLTGTDENYVKAPSGYFDPVMTGGATNQGIVRYLTEDAQVSPDGSITPGDTDTVTGSRAPLMTRPEMTTLRYDPFDRQQMTASTIMQSSEVTRPTGTALMTFGGWNADDPIVVSQEFADAHRIRGAGGQERPLVVGDKISDLHGNKGVLSLVVDREMDIDAAREQGIEQEVNWFKANPQMDVVMSPFSLISRRNAGSARELMRGDVEDALVPGRATGPDYPIEALSGAVGQMRFVVTHMAVDEKTKIYDDEQLRAGKGRKASSQLAWALQSQDCPAIMREFYGHNSGAESNLREFLLTTGVDMDADGTLHVVGSGDRADSGPERRLIGMPELQRTRPRKDGQMPGLNTTAMRKSFGELIGDRGGDMEIPFPLKYPTGQETEMASGTSWKLPIMSSHLRSGQEFEDGTSVTHDYTRSYQDVFVESCRYRFMAEQLEQEDLSAERRSEIRSGMSDSISRAQRSFEAISTDVQNRVLSGKNNIFKTGLMSSRLSDSATMVWTGDPRLDIDQVALSSVKAEQLGLAEGDHALIWRDPVLRDAGVRYMRVAIDDRLTGAAINPVMDQCFDGDFDGDSVAVVKLHTQAAKVEAMDKLSVPANLLDKGVVEPDGSHPLAMQVSLDTKVAMSKDPELAEEFDSLKKEANALRFVPRDDDMLANRREDVTEQLSDLYRQAQRSEFGSALSFGDRDQHVQSMREVCVDTGAKGNEQKLTGYERNLGDADGTPGITAQDQEESMFATAIKAHGTGLGGSFSQRAVRALRGDGLKSVLEVTYPVTQSILQAKHDAAEARHKYEMLQGPGRDLWRGRKIEHVGPNKWSAQFADGEPTQATAEEWQDQFIDFYESKEGFGVTVNPDHVAAVAHALEDPETGLIRNLEEDPSLQGTVMDRMAYGGDFETLLEAAKKGESVFEGDKNEQFACAGTRRARQPEARVADLTGELDDREAGPVRVDDRAVKADVVADAEQSAKARGASRRSAHAVGVGRSPAYVPSIEIDHSSETDSDYGMGS